MVRSALTHEWSLSKCHCSWVGVQKAILVAWLCVLTCAFHVLPQEMNSSKDSEPEESPTHSRAERKPGVLTSKVPKLHTLLQHFEPDFLFSCSLNILWVSSLLDVRNVSACLICCCYKSLTNIKGQFKTLHTKSVQNWVIRFYSQLRMTNKSTQKCKCIFKFYMWQHVRDCITYAEA